MTESATIRENPVISGRLSKWAHVFCVSAAVLLLLTGLAKLLSAFGHSQALSRLDPILRLDYRRVFWLASVAEITVAAICLRKGMMKTKLWLIACLATNCLVYRVAALCLGVHICPCLGTLTQALPINPALLNACLWVTLCYLLTGSCSLIARTWINQSRNTDSPGSLTDAIPSQLRVKRVVMSCICCMSAAILFALLGTMAKSMRLHNNNAGITGPANGQLQ